MRRRYLCVSTVVALLLSACGTSPPTATSRASDSHAPLAVADEATFLRVEVVDNEPAVLVVAVDGGGDERQLARLHGAWAAYEVGGYLHPMGAVSPDGYLAMPSSRGAATGRMPLMKWEIYDLHEPEREPVGVAGIRPQDIEQLQLSPYFKSDMRPSVFWNGERFVIPWYDRIPDPNDSRSFTADYHVTVVDPRTGATSRADLDRVRIEAAETACRTEYQSGATITVSPDGVGRRDADGSLAQLRSTSRVGYACISPDESLIVHNVGIGVGDGPATASRPLAVLLGPDGEAFEIEGSFAGWLDARTDRVAP